MAWTVRDLLVYLDRVEPRLAQVNHFELLDITPETDARGIRRAFHRKAQTLHPDLYRLLIDDRDHERLTRVYSRIAEAYLVLRDFETRMAYLQSLGPAEVSADEESMESVLPPKARRLYRRAQAALRTGDYSSAVLELRMAVASAPDSAFLRQELEDALQRARGRRDKP